MRLCDRGDGAPLRVSCVFAWEAMPAGMDEAPGLGRIVSLAAHKEVLASFVGGSPDRE